MLVHYKFSATPTLLRTVIGLGLSAIISVTSLADEYDFGATKQLMQRYVDSGKLAGNVLLVMKDGEIVLHHATGMQDITAGKPMKTDSLFRIASQTKALTTVAAMMLYERGQLGLQDPVSKYIPAFKQTTVAEFAEDGSLTVVKAKREMTIHDLLTHTSGISYGWGRTEAQWKEANMFGWYFADRAVPIQEALAPLPSLPMAGHPGDKFEYGYSTDLLGAVIEIASGKSLKAFFNEEIINPLGMKDTFFFVPENKVARLATVYSSVDGGISPAPVTGTMESQGHYVSGPRRAYSGGAGLVSTAADYAAFLTMLADGGTADGKQFLKPETIDMMASNQIGDLKFSANTRFGYGFSLKQNAAGDTIRYGWGGAYHSNYYIAPKDGLVVVYLTQLIPAANLDDWDTIDASLKAAVARSYALSAKE